MPDLSWITARPVAHRGLHDAARGIVENTATAFQAAIAGNFAIECDLQVSGDGEAMVHHDDALGRLTEGSATLVSLPAAEIAAVRFKASPDRILRLGELLDLVAGRVTLLLELKSRFDGDPRLTRRVAEIAATYRGPVAAMSFDPKPVEALRRLAPALCRGIVAQRDYSHPDWDGLPAAEKRRLAFLLHVPVTRPHFIAYAVRDLPTVAPAVAKLWGVPLLTWTVRTKEERARAARYADQMIFEGFRP